MLLTLATECRLATATLSRPCTFLSLRNGFDTHQAHAQTVRNNYARIISAEITARFSRFTTASFPHWFTHQLRRKLSL